MCPDLGMDMRSDDDRGLPALGGATPTRGATAPRDSDRPVGGILCMLAGCLLITLNDAATKWLTGGYPVTEIIFLCGVLSMLMIVAIVGGQQQVATLLPHNLRFQIYRAGLFVMTVALFTIGLKLLPLPVVTAISFASPIIMTVLAGPLLGERAGWQLWLAVFAGFAGVVLIIDPGTDSWGWAALVPLGCALSSALRDITTRQLTAHESTQSILFVTAVVTTLAGLVLAPFGGWLAPTLQDWALFAFVGASQLAGHYFLVQAFRLAPAVVLAPFKYSMIVWALVLGFVVWGEVPSAAMSAGAVIVIGSGLFIFYRERERRPQAKKKPLVP